MSKACHRRSGNKDSHARGRNKETLITNSLCDHWSTRSLSERLATQLGSRESFSWPCPSSTVTRPSAPLFETQIELWFCFLIMARPAVGQHDVSVLSAMPERTMPAQSQTSPCIVSSHPPASLASLVGGMNGLCHFCPSPPWAASGPHLHTSHPTGAAKEQIHDE